MFNSAWQINGFFSLFLKVLCKTVYQKAFLAQAQKQQVTNFTVSCCYGGTFISKFLFINKHILS